MTIEIPMTAAEEFRRKEQQRQVRQIKEQLANTVYEAVVETLQRLGVAQNDIRKNEQLLLFLQDQYLP